MPIRKGLPIKRFNHPVALFLTFVLSWQTLFFALPMPVGAELQAEGAVSAATTETSMPVTDTTFSPADGASERKPVVEDTPTPAVADFSESLTKGVGFKFSKVDGAFVDFRLSDAPPTAPLTLGKTTLFSLPEGESVKYTTTDNQVKEEIVLSARPTSNEIAFGFSSSGLKPQPTGDGGYALVDDSGDNVFSIPAPTVVDANGKSGKITLDFLADQAVLSIDPAFLDSAAYPIVVDPTLVADLNGGGAGLTSQRNTFYDSRATYNKHWVLYSDDTTMRARYSSDGGANWTQAGTSSDIAGVTSGPYFSTYANLNSGTVFVAYRSGNDIYARQATIGQTGLNWGSPTQVFSGTNYAYPSISQATGGKLWVAARYYSNSTYKIRVKRSTNAASVAAWDSGTEENISENSSDATLTPPVFAAETPRV